MHLTYEELRDAIEGGFVGLRARTTLQPLGGAGDKVFPPTYQPSREDGTKYAFEDRRIDGATVRCVLVDSVASQANRMEAALLAAARSRRAPVPYVTVDFSDTDVADLDEVTSMEAPHRVYDAILRDSLLDGTVFRLSEPGIAITEATVGNAMALFRYAPTTLLFGGWDSTGPKGGQGTKVERAITSELVGVGVQAGVRVGSRLDPLGIETQAGPLYRAKDGTGLKWTDDPDEAAGEKGKPVLFDQSGGEGKAGNPSKVNHGNVTPTIDDRAGGVTVDEVRGTTVLSFVQLRRIALPVDSAGDAWTDRGMRHRAELAARTAIAALGVLGMVLAFDEGFDLRSRCVLVADSPLEIELVGRTSDAKRFAVTQEEAVDLLNQAVAKVRDAGLPWEAEPVRLVPAPQLVDLVTRSRDLSAQKSPDEE